MLDDLDENVNIELGAARSPAAGARPRSAITARLASVMRCGGPLSAPLSRSIISCAAWRPIAAKSRAMPTISGIAAASGSTTSIAIGRTRP